MGSLVLSFSFLFISQPNIAAAKILTPNMGRVVPVPSFKVYRPKLDLRKFFNALKLFRKPSGMLVKNSLEFSRAGVDIPGVLTLPIHRENFGMVLSKYGKYAYRPMTDHTNRQIERAVKNGDSMVRLHFNDTDIQQVGLIKSITIVPAGEAAEAVGGDFLALPEGAKVWRIEVIEPALIWFNPRALEYYDGLTFGVN